ncbi:DNA-directed RNA polymerase II subunit RPB1, putative [Entamoeba invadens IP1]|uniref:DNA-directed RNA polymerase subunit n=1 Tax=Entamoeba invadens IP1 TaxID=370355 RepID=A0A0A1UD26_ENTIV|nr:DNA-directed RNA polymerase II subunit RPB1, putative [Entamoeba invadens IP1]ELP94337.1 DNA-directed RNA polymerase II subunit RPB1, putative [Entamoeba invadens IP1]|eukprot:XP_004261108.1 DNA-directed RNA polymerase II subunit RPB1, putative [Entamoeba invadens IP1]
MEAIGMETKRVQQIKFTLMSTEDIKKMAVLEVVKAEEVDDGKPVEGGLSDPRMGPFDKGDECKTCRCTRSDCPGHFGYIQLYAPVYNPVYVKYILKVLKCVCPSCHRLYCHDDERLNSLKSKGEERLKDVYDIIDKDYIQCGKRKDKKGAEKQQQHEEEDRICHSAKVDYELPKSKLENKLEIRYKGSKAEESKFMPRDALNILKEMTDEDVKILGFDPKYSHPKFMVFEVFPVAPPAVRPQAVSDKGSRNNKDDLTVMYENIIRANEELKNEQSKVSGINRYDEIFKEVQTICAKVCLKNVKDLPDNPSKKKYKSIEDRLSGKQGRMRLNLMGKRVDFSARTVISPDPNLSMDEVGVPTGIAKILTFPEVVTRYNMDKLQSLVNAGMNSYPGAFMLQRKNGETFRLNGGDKILNIGDVVHRFLMDGDYVIFNRQPSLHRMSMMGHRARVLPFSTFRMNLCDTTPYNADFDGDEMNLHIPQTLEARAEISVLMMTPTQIITPEKNCPIMGIVQDTQCGSYIITKRQTFIEKLIFYNILQWLDKLNVTVPIPAILKPKPLWTGKQVFTLILPPINYENGDYSIGTLLKKGPCYDDSKVYIHKGILVTGYLCNSSGFGKNQSGIVHSIYKDVGMEATKIFFNQTQATVNSWMLTRGFTVGLGDIVVKQDVHDRIREAVKKSIQNSEKYLDHKHDDEIEPVAGQTMFQNLETKLSLLLSNVKTECDKITKDALKKDNNLLQMVDSGSKGSNSNISQMVAFVGKQEINNQRIPFGFYKRTLPHYWKEDYGFVTRGFCENSFVMGLSPQEVFFHAMAGRQGIIDTAIKTSETGYIQRRLVKSMEDVQCKYDRTVRRTTGDMVEFMYGSDGVDALMCESQKFPYCLDVNKMNDASKTVEQVDEQNMKKLYQWDFSDPNLKNIVSEDVYMVLLSDECLEATRKEYDNVLNERAELYAASRQMIGVKPEDVHVVVHFDRQISNVIATSFNPFDKGVDLDPKYVIEQENNLVKRLAEVGVSKTPDAEDKERAIDALRPFSYLMHAKLSSKQCILGYRMCKAAFDDLMKRMENIYLHSRVNPGEMIGSIAAQSIGAPATQMTLNTFHHAGTSEATVTEGVPRLKELLNMSKMPKTPSMTVWLTVDPDEKKSVLDKELNTKIPFTLLKDLVEKVEIWFDPNLRESVVEEDREFLAEYAEISDINQEKYSKWTIRMLLGYNKIVAMGIDVDNDNLKKRVSDKFPSCLVIQSDSNHVVDGSVKIVLYIRFPDSDVARCDSIENLTRALSSDREPVAFHKKMIDQILNDVQISGVVGISKIIIRDKPTPFLVIDPETKLLHEKKQWVIFTEGSNMVGLTQFEEVDFTKTVTNNVYEVYQFLGIEAGRIQLASEFIKCLSGSYVNYRHLGLLADVMTHTGRVEPVNRMGLSRSHAGVITRASFEQTLEQFRRAAAFGESDMLNGVSQNVLMGQRTIVGTGAFTVLIDVEKLQRLNVDAEVLDDSEESEDVKAWDGLMMSPIKQKASVQFSPSRSQLPNKTQMGYQSPIYNTQMGQGFKTSPRPMVTPAMPVQTNTSSFNKFASPSLGGASPYIIQNASPILFGAAQASPLFRSGPSPYQMSSPQNFASPNFASPQLSRPTPPFTQFSPPNDDKSECFVSIVVLFG